MLHGKMLSKHLELVKAKPAEDKAAYSCHASHLDLLVFSIEMINKSLKTTKH